MVRAPLPLIQTRRGAHDSTTIVISNVPHSKVAKDQATVEEACDAQVGNSREA